MSLFDDLKAGCPEDWRAYTDHAFVCGLSDGSLPDASFRHYLKQDYLFLIQFARAFALAGYKARTLDDLHRAKAGMGAILDIELSLHIAYCRDWGLSEADLLAEPAAAATLAYTSYVLERGMAGDLLDLHVALAPCMLGYGEIGRTLAAAQSGGNNPYAPWIAMYAGTEYQAACRDELAYLDALAGSDLSTARRADLRQTFRAATRLEIAFWQMGMDLSF